MKVNVTAWLVENGAGVPENAAKTREKITCDNLVANLSLQVSTILLQSRISAKLSPVQFTP